MRHDEDHLVEELCSERRGKKRFSVPSSSSSSSPESLVPRHLEPKEWQGRNRGPTSAPPPPSSPPLLLFLLLQFSTEEEPDRAASTASAAASASIGVERRGGAAT